MTATPVPGAALRIVIADDQASVREGLVLLLGGLPDIEVFAAAADGEQALALVQKTGRKYPGRAHASPAF